MGFASYSDYLRSEHWRNRRNTWLRKHPACFVCGTTERVLAHHRTYKRLGKEKTRDAYRADLVTLCGPCHGMTHRVARWNVTRRGINGEQLGGAHTKVRDHIAHQSQPCGSALCRMLFA